MRPRALLAAGLAALAAACGIDALGNLVDVEPPVRTPDDDATIDRAPSSDAGDGGKGCDGGVVSVEDTFAVLDGGSWLRVADLSNAPYPQIDPTSDGLGASLVNPAAVSSLGALWLRMPVPLHAFDVSFRYVMPCEAGACSDGLAVAWLEATDAGAAALSGYVVAKASFGLPQLLRGSAVAFDLHQDAITGDPAAPYLSPLALDGAVPGRYDWHSKTAARPDMTGTHAVSLRLRRGRRRGERGRGRRPVGPRRVAFRRLVRLRRVLRRRRGHVRRPELRRDVLRMRRPVNASALSIRAQYSPKRSWMRASSAVAIL